MNDIYDLAIKLYHEGRYNDTRTIIKVILPHHNKSGDVYNTLGMVEQNLNNYKEAYELFKFANILEPDNKHYKNNLENIEKNNHILNMSNTSTNVSTHKSSNKPTVIISGHIPIDNSGYSNQTFYLAKILIEQGYNVTIIGWNATGLKDFQFKELTFNDIMFIYKNLINFDEYLVKNQEKIPILEQLTYFTALEPSFPCFIQDNQYYDIIVNKINPKFIVFIQDIYVMKFSRFLCPTITWLPIHSEPLDKLCMESVSKFDSIVTLSEFGKKQVLNKFSDKSVTIIPHIIDDELFYEIDELNYKANLRKQYNISEEAYVCLLISNNSEPENRKAFDVNLGGFADFQKNNKNAHLHIHTNVNLAFKIMDYLKECDVPENKYTVCDQTKYKKKGYSDKEVADLYRMSDVLLYSTCVEGFGLPMLEAQSCGCPVIVNNFSTPPEYTKYGIICEIEQMVYKEDFDAYTSMPSRSNLVEALEEMITWDDAKHYKLKMETKEFLKEFTYQKIKESWIDHIKAFEKQHQKSDDTIDLNQKLFLR